MSSNQFEIYLKRAWWIYSFITLTVIVFLDLFIAEDDEELFFFTIMPAAAAYVMRPTRRAMGRWVQKYTGVAPPAEEESK